MIAAAFERSVGSVWFVRAIGNRPHLWYGQTMRFLRNVQTELQSTVVLGAAMGMGDGGTYIRTRKRANYLIVHTIKLNLCQAAQATGLLEQNTRGGHSH